MSVGGGVCELDQLPGPARTDGSLYVCVKQQLQMSPHSAGAWR